MCILKELSVPIGSVFQVRLMLEEDEPPLELVARIVSVARTQDTYGRNLFRMGIEFTGIPDAKRKIIVRKVFKIQQENAARSAGKQGDSPHYETKK
jgi:c-di-GMP-binding flagellar brake protein YcgR